MTGVVRYLAATRDPDAPVTAAPAGFDRLVLDSPANRNALSLKMLEELIDRVAFSASGHSRGLAVSHTGTALCAGVDLRERRDLGRSEDAHSRLLGALLLALWKHPKPVVVAVDGAVRGGGMGLLACADLVIASPASTFGYSETRVGVAPALVMAVTLPVVPQRRLMPWLLSGTVFGAEEALALGVVTRLDEAPRTTGLDAALGALAAAAPHAQRSVKSIARAAVGLDIPADIERATRRSADLFLSAEADEGMAAFAEKRPPRWPVPPRATDPDDPRRS